MTFSATLVEYRYSLGVESNSSSTSFSNADCNSRNALFIKSQAGARSSSPASFQTVDTDVDLDQAEMLDDENLAWGSMSEKCQSQTGLIGGLRKKFISKGLSTKRS